MENEKVINDPQYPYMIQVQKVTSLGSGESITIATNVPKSVSKEDLLAEVQKILWVVEERLIVANEKVLKLTELNEKAADAALKAQAQRIAELEKQQDSPPIAHIIK